ncbi:hypothetical protein KZ813_11730 [Sphingomonas sp. RHCKR7]|uniref:hypothetical protein n=1 Tax=Sphingomonas folli TaxID=2862497 RepID=UPI001CA5DBF2|nr:hypothetical protein [Sphingomonas folli]MBW6527510.1 hypothetical protein [Sphingomonas folli]
MDFMKWLNSLDELLYEVMSWLLFFPLTLWRAAFRPIRTMTEIEREAALPDEQRYGSVLSPPLFLALALLLGHTVATAMGQTDAIIASHHGLADLVNDNASALVLRVIVFAAFPLFLAARLVRRRGVQLDRSSLQQPFYEQCYPAAVFALGISIGTSLGLDAHPTVRTVGHWLAAGSIANYWIVEARWFSRVLRIGLLPAIGNVCLGLLEGTIFLIAVGFLFTR